MHYYVASYVYRNIFGLKNIKIIILSIALLSVLSFLFRRIISNPIFSYFTFLSYVWMGLVLISVFLFLSGDLFFYIFKIENRKFYSILILILIFLIAIKSIFNSFKIPEFKNIHFNTVLKENIKIAVISDMHIDYKFKNRIFLEIMDKIEREKPDLIVFLGDLIDPGFELSQGEMERIKNLKIRKIGILGNHEYYRGWKQAIDFTQKAGFKLLRNEFINVGDILYIVGMDDKTCKYFNACDSDFDEARVLRKIPKDKFILLLKHQPEIKKEAIGLFDIMLSGHTHGGLYKLLGAFIMKKIYETDRGLKYLGRGSYLFVSKGVGTGGPPMRFLTPPDVAIIELINCKNYENKVE